MAEAVVKGNVESKDWKVLKRKPVNDPGFDETVKKLTPEKIEKAINAVINLRKSAGRFLAPLETCIHCALCAEACHWYMSHGKDPSYAPVAKVRMTLWEMIKRKGKVSPEFMKQAARIVFAECNLCRRCSMYCPYGLDIAYQLGMVRRICFLLGLVPQNILDQDNSHSATLNQLWITQGDWIDTMQWQEEEVRADIKNVRIPVDKEGADVMWCPLGTEPKIATYHIARTAKIMNVAGIDWTVASMDGWDCANMAMFIRDMETMQRVVRGIYENAMRLKIKRIVLTE
jgi:Fe-S oxidoreductase